MKKNFDYVKLVERAQLGDKHCLDRLTELAEERLREDVGRITLDHDLTQDIVQETLLEMCKILGKLKRSELMVEGRAGFEEIGFVFSNYALSFVIHSSFLGFRA
ncbi:MAG: hypothetical protein ACYS80_12425 [Planctomycetota bacterium]|jgi:hypothetical protein